MMTQIRAIAFDIDGTLYPNWRLYIKIIPYFLKNISFFINYSKVRKILHRTAPLSDFYEYQSRLLAEKMHTTPAHARSLIEKNVYDGLKPYFPFVRPFSHIEETFRKCKEAGLKIAILSDFPPSQKGDIWGTAKYCDVIIGSEGCGALKPSKYTFGILALKLGLNPEEILYVGNSISSDVEGANSAGMKSAYLMPLWRRILNRPLKCASISFKTYRQLQGIVLK